MRRGFAHAGVVPTVVALVAAALVSGPSLAVAAENEVEFKIPKAPASKNQAPGKVSAVGEALAKASETKKRVEIVSERDAVQTLFANPDGTMTQEVSQSPRFAKAADGSFDPIDTDLIESDGRLEPQVASVDASFSATGEGDTTRLGLGAGRSVALSFDGALGAPQVEGPAATYPVEAATPIAEQDSTSAPEAAGESTTQTRDTAAPSADSVVVASREGGFLLHVLLKDAPSESPEYRFPLKTAGLTPVLDGQVLYIKDGDKIVAESQPLRMWDSRVDEAGDPLERVDVDAALERDGEDHVLVLRPSLTWLQDEKREYPVTIDPDITRSTAADTYIFSTQSSDDPRGGDVNLLVGSDDGSRIFRSILTFRYNGLVGTNVTNATLKLKQYWSGGATCTAQPIVASPTVSGDASIATQTWANRPSRSTDERWYGTASFNRHLSNAECPQGPQTIDVTSMVNGWSGKHEGSGAFDGADNFNRQSIQLAGGKILADERIAARHKRFCSANWVSTNGSCADSGVVPTLSISFDPDLGTQSWYSTTDHPFNAYSSLSVNNRNGNAIVSATDGSMNGVGLNLDLTRTYNSQATITNTSVGKGWNLGIGSDVWLRKQSEYRYDYVGPTGTILGSFVRKTADSTDTATYRDFETPIGGVGAELEQTDDGFTLTFKKSRQKFEFNSVTASGNAHLTKIRDRSDNAITFGYDGTVNSRPKLSTIADSGGHVLDVTYTGNYITAITESTNYTQHPAGARSWTYSYNGSGQLTSHTDPEGKTTTYAYNTGGLLSKITGPGRTKPDNKNNTSETELTYGINSSGEAQVSSVRYRYDDDGSTAAWHTYSWTYLANIPAVCESNGTYATRVTDPRANNTTYCFQPRDDTNGKTKVWVYDPLGKMKSQDYTADNGAEAFTSATGASTVNTYSGAGFQDRVEEVTEPKNSSSENSASTGLEYNTSPSTVEGGAYLPSALRTSTGDCNRYGYDDKGRTTTAYTGISSTATGSSASTAKLGTCASGTSGADAKFERRYNDNGTVSSSWDGNASSSPSDAEKTIYTYWDTADTGYVAGSKGQLKSVRKPGGDCATGANRKLCTSYTYDGAARVTSVTDGRGKVTAYQYNRNDQVVRARFDTTDLNCALNLGVCIDYTYDSERNVLTRSQTMAARNSTFYYDRMNRLVGKTAQVDGSTFDFSTSAFDGVGNIVYDQTYVTGAPDSLEVNYIYNAANRLTQVRDWKAADAYVANITTDDDGRTTGVDYLNSSSTSVAEARYDYTTSGRPKTMRWLNASDVEQAKVDYSFARTVPIPALGISVQFDSPQMQKRTLSGAGAAANQTGETGYTYTRQRLTKAVDTNGTDYDYTYDKIGNVTKEIAGSTTTNYGYNKAGVLCWQGSAAGTSASPSTTDPGCAATPSGNATVNSDAAGNSLGTSTAPITLNQLNQVNQIDGNAHTYLDQGNDLRRDSAGNREYDSGRGITGIKRGNSYEYYVRDPNGTLLATQVGSTVTYAASEPNGNVLWLLNTSGTRVGAYKYAPYGATTATGAAAAANRFRWIGAQQDTRASGGDGHYKLGARYYNTNGQFTQPDPVAGGLSDPRTLTGYNYAGGDPINQADPSGYAFFSGGVSICALACIEFGVGTDGDFDPSIGFSVGPEIGVRGKAGPGFGTNEGGEVSASCSAGIGPIGGFAQVGVSSGPSFSVQNGIAFGLGGGCSVGASYTF